MGGDAGDTGRTWKAGGDTEEADLLAPWHPAVRAHSLDPGSEGDFQPQESTDLPPGILCGWRSGPCHPPVPSR